MSLRQRWDSSVLCLILELSDLHSPLPLKWPSEPQQSLQLKPRYKGSNNENGDISKSDTSDAIIDDMANEISTITSNNNIILNEATSMSLSLISAEWFDKVTSLYAEPHRAYHTITHVRDVLSCLDYLLGQSAAIGKQTSKEPKKCEENDKPVQLQSLPSPAPMDVAITTLAAFFHDAVYNPKSSSNEKDSAILFMKFVTELSNQFFGIKDKGGNVNRDKDKPEGDAGDVVKTVTVVSSPDDLNIVKQVYRIIIATATHISSSQEVEQALRRQHEQPTHNHVINSSLSDSNLVACFLDADMSILGSSSQVYYDYACAIRKEYIFVPKQIYCQKRSDILTSFLPAVPCSSPELSIPVRATTKHSFLYATGKGRMKWETQARENLIWEIELLRQGIIPDEILSGDE